MCQAEEEGHQALGTACAKAGTARILWVREWVLGGEVVETVLEGRRGPGRQGLECQAEGLRREAAPEAVEVRWEIRSR